LSKLQPNDLGNILVDGAGWHVVLGGDSSLKSGYSILDLDLLIVHGVDIKRPLHLALFWCPHATNHLVLGRLRIDKFLDNFRHLE
jgi:hypothetical protein